VHPYWTLYLPPSSTAGEEREGAIAPLPQRARNGMLWVTFTFTFTHWTVWVFHKDVIFQFYKMLSLSDTLKVMQFFICEPKMKILYTWRIHSSATGKILYQSLSAQDNNS
jgi:hypothetical protein